jgi:hypothetical protein
MPMAAVTPITNVWPVARCTNCALVDGKPIRVAPDVRIAVEMVDGFHARPISCYAKPITIKQEGIRNSRGL